MPVSEYLERIALLKRIAEAHGHVAVRVGKPTNRQRWKCTCGSTFWTQRWPSWKDALPPEIRDHLDAGCR